MRMLVLLGAAGAGAVGAAGPVGAAPHEARLLPAARPVPLVVVLRRPGLRAYEKVIDEFRGGVPAEVRVLSTPGSQPGAVEPPASAVAWSRGRQARGSSPDMARRTLRRWLERTRPDLLFAVGQPAYDLARDSVAKRLPVIHAMVLHRIDPADRGVDSQPPPQVVLLAFAKARPGIERVAVLHGPESAGQLSRSRELAAALRIDLQPLLARTPSEAIRLLHQVLGGGVRRERRRQRDVEGIWLIADLQVLTPQVFQYAVWLQFRHRVPLMAATAGQVQQGALFAVDFAPTVIGRRAAELARQALGARREARGAAARSRGRQQAELERDFRSTAVRLTLNRRTAGRIGVAPARLEALAPEVLR